jgi:hypothetical protein
MTQNATKRNFALADDLNNNFINQVQDTKQGNNEPLPTEQP